MMVQKADFNPLSEVGLLKDYSKEPIRMHFNPLNEVFFKKDVHKEKFPEAFDDVSIL
jgi:hypothetical protein